MDINDVKPVVKLTGDEADLLKYRFAREVMAREANGGDDRAKMLIATEDYAIVFELYKERLLYRVILDGNNGGYVGFGPNFVHRIVKDSAPSINLGVPEPDYAYAAG